jgi:4-hydroxybenzoate polyprenyltransferase/phosphoserine phosphatase
MNDIPTAVDAQSNSQSAPPPPLVVDLDGTLLRSDLLAESAFAYLGHNPLRAVNLLAALGRGKAALKAEIAEHTSMDVTRLPYNEDILALIRKRRALGCHVYLASASNERYVKAIADHLGLFDGWFASSKTENLSADTKARRLVEVFGKGGFDYVGNNSADLAVWNIAHQCFAVGVTASVRAALTTVAPGAAFLGERGGDARAWFSLLRVKQWAKNALVFVPLVTAHRLDIQALIATIAAFVAFSLVASAVYIVNDLVDLEADRKHPMKTKRALASGAVPIANAIALVPVLASTGCGVALVVSPHLAAVLAAYIVLTTAYTFQLKRKMMIDVIALACLYTIRVIGGAAAISVEVSFWLLGFSMFIFTSLALIKRYIELTMRIDEQLADSTNRNYRKSDLPIVGALAAAAGFNAVTVFALYISSDAVRPLYRTPEALWLVCPLLMYWLGRALMLADRRLLDDDPIAFALRDWNSYAVLALVALTLVLAT